MSSITPSQSEAYIKLKRLDKAVQGCALIAIISSIAIIVLTGLSVAGYIRPLLPLYILPIPIGSFFIAKVLENRQKTVCKASRPKINYDAWNHQTHKPPKDSKSKKKNKTK